MQIGPDLYKITVYVDIVQDDQIPNWLDHILPSMGLLNLFESTSSSSSGSDVYERWAIPLIINQQYQYRGTCGGADDDDIDNVGKLERLRIFLTQKKQLLQCLAYLIESVNGDHVHIPSKKWKLVLHTNGSHLLNEHDGTDPNNKVIIPFLNL